MTMLQVVRRERLRIRLLAVPVAWVLAAGIAHGGAGRPLPPPCTAPPSPDPIVAQLNGEDPLDRLGHAVAFGDVNGDGTADLIVGAPIGTRAKSGSIDRPGYVRIYNGANLAQSRELTDPDANPGGLFGWRVASGNATADEFADVVVAALRAETSRRLEDQGSIWIFRGDANFFSEEFVIAPFRRIDGEKATEQLGESLALADLNSDGHADLLAGAWSYDPGSGGTNKNNGIVRLYDGARLSNGAPDAKRFERVGTQRAEGIQDEMGRAVAFGDVGGDPDANGNPILDLILGAGGGQGYVEVISGADVIDCFDPDVSPCIHPPLMPLRLFRGDLSVGNEDQFGRALAAADLNGDGRAEVIAGAHVGDGNGLGDSGWVRVFDGASATGALLFPQLNGTSALDHFGKSVAVGDIDGDPDGQLDVIVGAEWGTPLGSPPGAGYVRAFNGLTGAELLTVHGSCDSDHLGTSVAVHDVDDTGRVNILAGAPDGDAGALLDNGYIRLYQDMP